MAEQNGVDDDRRGALKALMTAGGAAFACGAVIPAARLLAAPALVDARGGGGKWVRVARLADLAEGQPKRADVIADKVDAWNLTPNERIGTVWLMRKGDEVHALSATCPHLGCGIDYLTETKKFDCPCHASDWDGEGKRIEGPSPRDMDPLETRIVPSGADKIVEVNFKAFRQGIAKREEIG